jgi:hypothetical protein
LCRDAYGRKVEREALELEHGRGVIIILASIGKEDVEFALFAERPVDKRLDRRFVRRVSGYPVNLSKKRGKTSSLILPQKSGGGQKRIC